MVKNMRFKFIVLILGSLLMITACNNRDHENIQNENTITEQTGTSLFPEGDKLSNEWFHGDAYLQPLLSRDRNHDFSLGSVTFKPEARTHWHSHPRGQVLIVTEGIGWHQIKGKPVQVIEKGDVVNIPEDVEHWHGASADHQMVHIALTNYVEDENVTWLEPVTDEEYNQTNNR